MITKIKIDGFKSFQNFEMEFTPFTIIAGINASGKSNLFDALKLLARLAETDNIKKAFKEQRGEFLELFTQIGENDYAQKMTFEIEMLVNKNIKDDWGGQAIIRNTRLRYELILFRKTNDMNMEDIFLEYENLEIIKKLEDTWIKIIPKDNLFIWKPKIEAPRGVPYITTKAENGTPAVLVSQDGTTGNKRRYAIKSATRTILSSFDAIDFPHVLAVKEEMRSWKFLQFNPQDLRMPTNKNTGEDKITQSGANLAGALYRIKQKDAYNLKDISRKLQHFLPNFIEVDVIDDKENQQFLIVLTDKDKKKYTSRVLSEGTLRILALCILENDDQHKGLLCFEEPENGIHPFRMQDMVSLLRDLSTDFSDEDMPLRQVIINTHSPLLANKVFSTKNRNTSLWYAQMRNKIIDVTNKRISLHLTNILPVIENEKETLFPDLQVSEEDRKIAYSKFMEYLNTNN